MTILVFLTWLEWVVRRNLGSSRGLLLLSGSEYGVLLVGQVRAAVGANRLLVAAYVLVADVKEDLLGNFATLELFLVDEVALGAACAAGGTMKVFTGNSSIINVDRRWLSRHALQAGARRSGLRGEGGRSLNCVFNIDHVKHEFTELLDRHVGTLAAQR